MSVIVNLSDKTEPKQNQNNNHSDDIISTKEIKKNTVNENLIEIKEFDYDPNLFEPQETWLKKHTNQKPSSKPIPIEIIENEDMLEQDIQNEDMLEDDIQENSTDDQTNESRIEIPSSSPTINNKSPKSPLRDLELEQNRTISPSPNENQKSKLDHDNNDNHKDHDTMEIESNQAHHMPPKNNEDQPTPKDPTKDNDDPMIEDRPLETSSKYTWTNGWFGLLEAIGTSKQINMKLHEVFYSHQWIRERFLLTLKSKSKHIFDDYRLIDLLKSILRPSTYCYLPYLLASISGKSIKVIRSVLALDGNNQIIDSSSSKTQIQQKFEKLNVEVKKLLPLVECYPKPNYSKVTLNSLIYIFENMQRNNDLPLLEKLCERSKVILDLEVRRSGGFFVINSIDDVFIPNFTVSFSFYFTLLFQILLDQVFLFII